MYIYELTINKYKYIGSTKNKRKRKSDHLRLLKLGKHFNKFIQNVYNKYPEYEFQILEYCNDIESMKEREEEYIKQYRIKYGKFCMNILNTYGGGSEWRKYKTSEELKLIDYKRTRISPEKRLEINKKHSETIQNIPISERQNWYDRAAKKRADNIKLRKNYTPINIKIIYPNGLIEIRNYDTEPQFFKDTNLEDSSLRQIKNNGKKIIKKRLNFTRHNFPVGTIIEKLSN